MGLSWGVYGGEGIQRAHERVGGYFPALVGATLSLSILSNL